MASTSSAMWSHMDGTLLTEDELTAVSVLSSIQPQGIRRRMSLLQSTQQHRNKEAEPEEVCGVKPRRNPRRLNVVPKDYRSLERTDYYPESCAKVKVRVEHEHIQQRQRLIPIKPVTGKTRSESQKLGAVFRPASPLSSLPWRTWPVTGMHERPVWPDPQHELPPPMVDAAPMGITMHHVLHAMLDFGLEMAAERPRRYRLEEKLMFMEAMLNKKMAFKKSTGEVVVHLVDNHVHYDFGQRMTVMNAKVKRMTAMLEARAEGEMSPRLENGVDQHDQETEGTSPSCEDGVDASKALCIGLMPACMKCVPQEDESNLLGALLCDTGYLYCLTNDVAPEQLAKYLDGIRDGLSWH